MRNNCPTILHLFGEEPFFNGEANFTIGRTSHTYTLQFSDDMERTDDTNAHWEDFSGATEVANKPVDVKNQPRRYWRLKNNTGKFVVRF